MTLSKSAKNLKLSPISKQSSRRWSMRNKEMVTSLTTSTKRVKTTNRFKIWKEKRKMSSESRCLLNIQENILIILLESYLEETESSSWRSSPSLTQRTNKLSDQMKKLRRKINSFSTLGVSSKVTKKTMIWKRMKKTSSSLKTTIPIALEQAICPRLM